MEILVWLNPADLKKARRLVGHLEDKGIVSPGDQITVAPNRDVSLVPGQTSVVVNRVYRDGEAGRGPVDVLPESYTITNIKKR